MPSALRAQSERIGGVFWTYSLNWEDNVETVSVRSPGLKDNNVISSDEMMIKAVSADEGKITVSEGKLLKRWKDGRWMLVKKKRWSLKVLIRMRTMMLAGVSAADQKK